MNVAYLLNQYPMPSQTFVRRELAALDASGWEIARISVRPVDEAVLVDPADRAERTRTRYVLGGGAAPRLARATARAATRDPGRFLRALRTALRLSRGSNRPLSAHLAYLAEACVVVEWLRRDGIDHVHTHFGTNGPAVAMLVQQLGGPPFSFTVHGPEEFDRPDALHLGEKIHAAAFVVAISSFGRSQLLRWCEPEDWHKVRVVRCGLDADFTRLEPTPNSGARRLVCVGRLAEQKGQLLLIEAAVRMFAEGDDFELVLAGEGPLRGALEAAIDAAGATGRVRITGWVDNATIRQELQSARALVLPSFAEGLPVAIMESLALARPVVTTTIAGVPELVDPECGWVVPAGSVDDLVVAMRDALDAPTDRLDAMGRVGRSRVLEAHDAATEAAVLAEAFVESERSAPRRGSGSDA